MGRATGVWEGEEHNDGHTHQVWGRASAFLFEYFLLFCFLVCEGLLAGLWAPGRSPWTWVEPSCSFLFCVKAARLILTCGWLNSGVQGLPFLLAARQAQAGSRMSEPSCGLGRKGECVGAGPGGSVGISSTLARESQSSSLCLQAKAL